jgi:thymidylate kinase
VTAPFRLAIVGIDGTGKTSVVRRLRERNGVEGDVATLHSPIFHEGPNAPLGGLSRQLHAVSLAADALRLRELKMAMLYLQMTLFGLVERAMVDAYAPRALVSDRHAMVDSLAYGALYARMLGAELDGATVEPRLREHLAGGPPNALDATLDWHARVVARLGQDTTFWELPHEVASVFTRSQEELQAECARRFQTTMPDAVVLIDVPPEEALRRSATREAPSSELHEQASTLEGLRRLYAGALDALGARIPVHRVDGSGLSVDETLDRVLEHLPAR